MLSTDFLQHAVVAAAICQSALASAIPQRRQGEDTPSINETLPVRSLGSLSINKPAFATIITQDDEDALFISAFGMASSADKVHRINDIASVTAGRGGMSDLDPVEISGSIVWPNDATAGPVDIFGTEGIVVGGGFLVPGKDDGGIFFSPSDGSGNSSTSGDWVQLVAKDNWFYHRVVFADMDADGVLDMVSCRVDLPLVGTPNTMLVILKPQSAANPTSPWVETEIGPGCDALFTVADLDGDGVPEVVAASYFLAQLNLFHSAAETGFADPDDVQTVTLDADAGDVFDVEYVDVNGDGAPDLLVSNHNQDGTGAVFAYEVPATGNNITSPRAYTRHTLAEGFPVVQFGIEQASPGSPKAFYPTPESQGGKPYIALAGDATQTAYVLVPGEGEWEYTTTLLHDCGCTVGALGVSDVDGDGYAEVFVPCYDDNLVVGYTFAA